jgi:hypothetical protein
MAHIPPPACTFSDGVHSIDVAHQVITNIDTSSLRNGDPAVTTGKVIPWLDPDREDDQLALDVLAVIDGEACEDVLARRWMRRGREVGGLAVGEDLDAHGLDLAQYELSSRRVQLSVEWVRLTDED